ncbi:monooxygenase [Priestia endophytica]
MTYLLQVDFKFEGPFGDEMTNAFTDIANSINKEEGFIWKIWTENKETKEAGGIYLFETKEDAEKYLDMHTKRLKGFGITGIKGKIFETNEQLTTLNRGPLKLTKEKKDF